MKSLLNIFDVNKHQISPMLLGDKVNVLLKWLLKLYILSPTLSPPEKNLY